MARRRRLQFPGAVYHVMARGNRKSMIVDDDDDRRSFMDTFSRAAADHEVRVYSCCLMGTHYHLVIEASREHLSDGMRQLNGDYARRFNQRHGARGHLFAERFSSWVITDEDHLHKTLNYVRENPVRARLCARPEDWPWSG